jgi:hypothetical protein
LVNDGNGCVFWLLQCGSDFLALTVGNWQFFPLKVLNINIDSLFLEMLSPLLVVGSIGVLNEIFEHFEEFFSGCC